MSNRQDIKVAAGDTLKEGYQSFNELTGVVPTTTLTTVEFLVKNNLADADADAILARRSTVAAELTIDDAGNWKFTIKATPAETFALPPGKYKCVCKTIDSADDVAEAFRGNFTVPVRGSDPSS